MTHKRQHFIGNVVTLCQIEDRTDFGKVIARSAFPDSYRARLWADAYIAQRRLQAMRKHGHDFRDELFGLVAVITDLDFDPARPTLGVYDGQE